MSPAAKRRLTWGVLVSTIALLISIHLHLYARGVGQAHTDATQTTDIHHNKDDIEENRDSHKEDIKETRAMFKEILERLPRQ